MTDVMCIFREASLQDGTAAKHSHKTKQKKLNATLSASVSTGSCAASEQVTQSSAADDSVTPLGRRARNAKNALVRIESKTKGTVLQNISRDPAQEARTVFVGNVALTVKKKVICAVFSCVLQCSVS